MLSGGGKSSYSIVKTSGSNISADEKSLWVRSSAMHVSGDDLLGDHDTCISQAKAPATRKDALMMECASLSLDLLFW